MSDENSTVWFASALVSGVSAGAVEVDAVVVLEVRILAGVHAAGAEPDLPLVFVHLDHMAHGPRALGDLRLDRAGRAVDQIQVVPAVALRHPDHFLAVGEVVAKALAGLRAWRPSGCNRRTSWALRRSTARACPVCASTSMTRNTWWPRWLYSKVNARLSLRHTRSDMSKGFGKSRVSTGDLLLAAHVEQHRLLEIEQIARLRVLHRPVLRLQLILGRRGDVVHEAAVAWPDADTRRSSTSPATTRSRPGRNSCLPSRRC